jgi:energy-coupling factor transporter ATP-binding protein EcfA2
LILYRGKKPQRSKFMAFKQAERTQLWLRCALFGPSGSGKTMTALRMAKGIAGKMGGKVAVIDTESKSASKYSDRISFDVDDLNRKTVDDYIAAMNEAAKAGYKVLVIDSLSHAWRELTDEVDRITQASASKNSFLSWGKVNPKQKRLVEAILNFPGHIIATMRSKTEWVIGEGRGGKMTPEKMGLAPEQGKGIEYEFDLLVEINQQHQAIITKDRTGKFQDETIDKPAEEFGVALYEWLADGKVEAPSMAATTTISNVNPEAAKRTSSRTRNPEGGEGGRTNAFTSKINPLKEQGAQLVQEIGHVFNSLSPDGVSYFTEDEKAEGRNIVTATRRDEMGIEELAEFKSFIACELQKRQQKKAA